MRVPGDTAADVAANDAPLDIATLAADGSVAVARELVSFLSLLPRGTTDGDHARDLTRLRCAADFALRGYGAAFRDVTNVLLSAYVPRALEVVRDRLKRKERTELDVRLLTRFIFSSALLEHAFVVLPMHLKASEDGALGAVRVAAIIDDGAALDVFDVLERAARGHPTAELSAKECWETLEAVLKAVPGQALLRDVSTMLPFSIAASPGRLCVRVAQKTLQAVLSQDPPQ
jgi:hypothetical protein